MYKSNWASTLIVSWLAISIMSCGEKEPTVEVEIDARAKLGEGSLWHPTENKLYWIDIESRELHIYDPETKQDRAIPVGSRIGTVVPVKGGGSLVALQNGIHKIDDHGKLTFVVNPLLDSGIRFNDGKCDPAGRFWVGSMALDTRPGAASLYRMDHDEQIHLVIDSVTISNGIVWSADKRTMYYNDTPTQVVQAFDYDDTTGEISNRRVAVRIPDGMGSPDGMTIDEEGMLWVALWGGSCVARFNPATGELVSRIDVPAPNVTSCAFGGPGLETLYITTATDGMDDERRKQFPLSGNVFSIKPGVQGVPAFMFEPKLQEQP